MDPIVPIKDLTTEEVLYGDRITEYRWEVLAHRSDGMDYVVGNLDGVSAASLSWILNAAVKGGGKVRVADLAQAAEGMLRIGELKLESVRIRPVMIVNGSDRKVYYASLQLVEDPADPGTFVEMEV